MTGLPRIITWSRRICAMTQVSELPVTVASGRTAWNNSSLVTAGGGW